MQIGPFGYICRLLFSRIISVEIFNLTTVTYIELYTNNLISKYELVGFCYAFLYTLIFWTYLVIPLCQD